MLWCLGWFDTALMRFPEGREVCIDALRDDRRSVVLGFHSGIPRIAMVIHDRNPHGLKVVQNAGG
jgi:hypothetical protein